MYKVFNYLSIMLGVLAFILCVLPFIIGFPQGYILAILFSIPGMLSGLIALYLNLKHAYETTIKCLGFWGILINSIPVLVFFVILFMYKFKH